MGLTQAHVSNEISHEISHIEARFNDIARDFLVQDPVEFDRKEGFSVSLRPEHDSRSVSP